MPEETMRFYISPDCIANLAYWHKRGIHRVYWVMPRGTGGTVSCYTDKGQPHWL